MPSTNCKIRVNTFTHSTLPMLSSPLHIYVCLYICIYLHIYMCNVYIQNVPNCTLSLLQTSLFIYIHTSTYIKLTIFTNIKLATFTLFFQLSLRMYIVHYKCIYTYVYTISRLYFKWKWVCVDNSWEVVVCLFNAIINYTQWQRGDKINTRTVQQIELVYFFFPLIIVLIYFFFF